MLNEIEFSAMVDMYGEREKELQNSGAIVSGKMVIMSSFGVVGFSASQMVT